MNNTAKIIIGLVAGAVVLCLCLGVGGLVLFRSTRSVVGQVFNTEANKVENVSASIADYTLPDGFGSATTMQLAGFDMISYTGDDSHSHIYFFQLPAGVQLDPEEMERQFRQTAGEQGGSAAREIEVVDRVSATIRGQETTLVVSEGVNWEGQTFRQVSGIFQGDGGQAFVVFERPVDQWDQAEVDDFIASIQ
jgi:hypothetical protein